jgi:hypothetical protein
MRERLARGVPVLSVLLLAVWVISVAGGTGWSRTVNWALVLVALALLRLAAA